GVTGDPVGARLGEVGHTSADRHRVPVYFSGFAARNDQRRRLPNVRRGGYEALVERLATREGEPDAGPALFDARRGAVLVGARNVLVAYNIWLESTKLDVATAVARTIREETGGVPAGQGPGRPLTG